MASEVDALSEEASSSSCWSPPGEPTAALLEAEGSPSDGAEAAGCKLFLFNLARTVTDADLGPLFAPFNPIYSCVAIGKKGTSRRFGFARFVDRDSAAAALKALRGTELHGKLLDLKFALALGEPDAASGTQLRLRAKQRAGATQEAGFTHIAACQLQLDQASTTGSEAEDSWCMPQPPPQRLPTDPAAAVTARLVSQQPLATEHQAHVLQRVMADGPGPVIPSARGGAGTVPARLLDAPPPMHHMLIVPHGPGLSHDAVVQLVWYFRPLQISSSVDVPGQEKSSVLFSTPHQAHTALNAVTQRAAAEGYVPAIRLVSVPLHRQQAAELPRVPPHLLEPVQGPPGPQFMPAASQLPQQYAQVHIPALPPLPPAGLLLPQVASVEAPLAGPPMALPLAPAPARGASPPPPLPQQHHMPSAQQQREAVTMRPLYAGPRPTLLHPVHLLPPGYHPAYSPPPHGWALPGPSEPLQPCAAPLIALDDPHPPVPPPYRYLSPHLHPSLCTWPPAEGEQQALPAPAAAHAMPAGDLPFLPDTLLVHDGEPACLKRLNPEAATFCPGQQGQLGLAAVFGPSALQAPVPAPVQASTPSGRPVAMPPVIHSIYSKIEAALAGCSVVPAWESSTPDDGQPLQVAEAQDCDSGTEDEGEAEPDPCEVYAAVDARNLGTCFVTRALMRKLAPVELLLKQTAVGDRPGAIALSILEGAVVRLLVDKAYKLRIVQGTYVKPDTGRLMLVLHDISSAIPADHISNTCPLLDALTPTAEAELLELQAKLAFHGRRLYRHEVAAAAWRLQFGEHWAAQHGGKCGDELRLAVAHLRSMLRDEDEIRWRRRSVHSLDLAQETAAISAAFRLPWAAAANWMRQRSPGAKLAPASVPGASLGSADRSNATGDYETRGILGRREVMDPTVGIHMAPSRTACRSLVRCIADPGTQQRYMAAALGTYTQAPAPQAAAAPAGGTAASPGPEAEAGSLGSAAATSAGQAATSSTLQACSSSSGASGAVSPDAEPEQSLSEADQLLAEASSFGAGEVGVDWPPLCAFFNSSPCPRQSPRPASKTITAPASSSSGHKHASGAENCSLQAAAEPTAATRPATVKMVPTSGAPGQSATARILAVLAPGR